MNACITHDYNQGRESGIPYYLADMAVNNFGFQMWWNFNFSQGTRLGVEACAAKPTRLGLMGQQLQISKAKTFSAPQDRGRTRHLRTIGAVSPYSPSGPCGTCSNLEMRKATP